MVGTPGWTDGLGSAESESSDPDDSDDSNDSNSDEGTASSDGESESSSNTTRTSTTSSTVTSTTSSSATSTSSSTTSTIFGTTSSGTSSGSTSGWMTNGVTSAPDSGDDTADAVSISSTTTGPGGEEETGGEPVVLDCDAQMPTSGAMMHSGNGTGGSGNLAWEIWSNTSRGELITYDVPAFSAIWNEAGGYLGRLGYEWGGFQGNPVPHEEVGTITAQFVSRKSGSAGQYSYVGMYGWTTDPCVEWYVVDDSYNNMPINPGSLDMNFGTPEVTIDGGTYLVYKRPTTGTGGTRCSGATNWDQYYSVRTTARDCGQISLTEHFEAWESLGLPMGNLLEAKILVEVGGGQGRVDLPIANVMVTP